MTEAEMLEAEKHWCENCCNYDLEETMDGCSRCGEFPNDLGNYCPNCGAKMDGGKVE